MPRLCVIDGCDEPHRARGWCKAHYMAWWRHGDPMAAPPARWDGYVRPTCSVDGCDVLAHGRGMCSVHFCRTRRHGDPFAGRRPNATGTTEERFWSFVDLPDGPDGCWMWNGGCFVAGYSQFSVGGSQVYGHRWSHEHFIGPIPEGLTVDHTCHNADPKCPGGRCQHRRCVNPAHLEAVTGAENLRRGRERVRS